MFKSLLYKKERTCIMLLCMLFSMAATAQTRITGKVISSDDNQPVIGATVKIKSTSTGVVTDTNGAFTVSAKISDVLIISFIGYQPKNVSVTGASLGTITIEQTHSTLNEVVVTGYQTQLKKDISGSVATVDIGVARQLNVTSAENLLQGQAAGVTVVTSGQPGSQGQVLVRGISNLGNSAPLYVIDGVQEPGIQPSNTMTGAMVATSGGMSNLNPNDIESITVLKDAGATAIYGVRGGNGVIVITTKKGKAGKTRFSYDAFYGSASPKGGNVWNVLNGADYMRLIQKVDPQNTLVVNGVQEYGFQGPGVKGVGSASDPRANPSNYLLDINNPANDYLIQKFDNGAGTDWFHAVFNSAPIQQHSFSASGANGKNNYLFSLGYTDQQGTLIDSYLKRYQARINTNFSLNDHIRVGESTQIYYISNPGFANGNQNEGNAISMTYRMEPQIPVYDIKGNYGGTWDGPTQLGNAVNPVAMMNSFRNNQGKSWNIEGSAYAEVDFLKYFTVRSLIGGNVTNYSSTNITETPYWSGEGHSNANGFAEGAGFNSNYNWTNTVNYKEVFGKHTVTALGGFELTNAYGRFIQASQTNFFSLDPSFIGINNGTGTILASSGIPTNFVTDFTGTSLFGRIDYNYNSKYYLAATIRRDGSSLFYAGQQYGTFPSVSAAWRISQEDFLKSVSWLNDLKLRGSYGSSGYNGNVFANNAYSSYTTNPGNSSYPITGSISAAQAGFYATNYGNVKTTWETDKTTNIGFDATLFNHLDLTVEWYKRVSSNLLFQVPLPATTGSGTPPYVNVGQVSNKGIDASATYHGTLGREVKFSISANITSYKNNVDELSSPIFVNPVRNGFITRDAVGSPIGSFYGYKVIGYFSSAADVANSPKQSDAAPGRFKYGDTDGDGKITDNDRVNIGNPNPNFTYGVNLSLGYKGFDFSMVLYGSYGNKDYNYIKYWTNFYSTLTGNKSKDLLNNSWSPTNLNPKTPVAEAVSTFSTDGAVNSWYVESGSFLKCRMAQLGYTFNSEQFKAVGIEKLHVYVQGTNLFTITKYSGLDPELQSVASNGIGTDLGNYPSNERRIILGVNLTF